MKKQYFVPEARIHVLTPVRLICESGGVSDPILEDPDLIFGDDDFNQ